METTPSIESDAFMSTLNRTKAEVNALVEWDNRAILVASHLDPNAEEGI